jgi:hypothetical protein
MEGNSKVNRKDTTTIEGYGMDEVYCEWYFCKNPKCGCRDIMGDFKFCPMCGRQISGKEQAKY